MSDDINRPLANWRPPDAPDFKEIAGRYARLQRLDAETHAGELHRANSASDAIWDYLPYGPFASSAAYFRWAKEMSRLEDPRLYAVQSLETGRFCGVASYLRIAPDAGSIEVGHINFSTELQRSRAATEAIFLMMQWAFDTGYRRFEWKCDASNSASRRAAQRFGFSYEGTFRQASVVKGRNRDTAWFACIDAEWPALREAYAAWLAPENFDSNGQQIEQLGALTRLVRVASDPTL